MNQLCPICTGVAELGHTGGGLSVRCSRCGLFNITTTAKAMLASRVADDSMAIARASHYIVTHRDDDRDYLTVTSYNLDEVTSAKLPRPSRQRLNLLRYIAAYAGDDSQSYVEVEPFSAAGFVGARDADAVETILSEAEDAGLLEYLPEQHYRITHAGWSLLETSEDEEPKPPRPKPADDEYVDAVRIKQLRGLASPEWDVSRLIAMCEELNGAWRDERFLSVAMLVRAIVDHVPPVFSSSNFAQAASNAPRSRKKSFENLEASLRAIADRVLHEHIRRREGLPSRTQVNFRQDLDVLLEEVVVRLSP